MQRVKYKVQYAVTQVASPSSKYAGQLTNTVSTWKTVVSQK